MEYLKYSEEIHRDSIIGAINGNLLQQNCVYKKMDYNSNTYGNYIISFIKFVIILYFVVVVLFCYAPIFVYNLL